MSVRFKLVLIFCSLIVFSSVYAQSESKIATVNVNWETNYTKAVKIAKKTKKPILIFFTGSDWCGPCKMLTADFFETSKFKTIASKNLVLYEANFPRNHDLVTNNQKSNNNKLKLKYQVNSFPTVIIINSNGKVIGKRHSYNLMRDPSYYFKFIKTSLKL
jgi:thioredoxin-related protein